MPKSDASPQPDHVAFASELIRARNELGLTQSQLSAESGVSLSAIKGYETGRNLPGARELRDLSRTLRVTPNKLLFGTETPFLPLHSTDPGAVPGEKGVVVNRNRTVTLLNRLSYDECHAVYSLVRSIVVARFGEKEIRGDVEAADFMTSIQLLKENGGIEMDLLPKDPELLRTLASALINAGTGKSTTIELETGEAGLKVKKK